MAFIVTFLIYIKHYVYNIDIKWFKILALFLLPPPNHCQWPPALRPGRCIGNVVFMDGCQCDVTNFSDNLLDYTKEIFSSSSSLVKF